MTFKALRDKKIAILGIGLEGVATAEYFLTHNIAFSVFDEKSYEELCASAPEWEKVLEKIKKHNMPLFLGSPIKKEEIGAYDVVVRSPGISLKADFLKDFKGEITSHTKLFFDNCPAKIIGATGTKGKGTTSSLIYEMLKKAGFDAYLGGNIGLPPLSFLDTVTAQSVVVLEMSSFQLQDMQKSPHISVMLMVTQEHLDAYGNQNYHSSIEEYVEAKRNIFAFQTADDMAVINNDYPSTKASSEKTPAQVAWVSRYQEVENGCFVRDNKIILRIGGSSSQFSDISFQKAVNQLSVSQSEQQKTDKPNSENRKPRTENRKSPFFEYEIIDVADILLPGGHNLENVCAASMAAHFAGVDIADMAFVLKTFKGLEHRLELVREVEGVRYYDDSFSTVPETAIAAILAFSAPEILILGGSSKNSDFTE